jgi:hypothetical protein
MKHCMEKEFNSPLYMTNLHEIKSRGSFHHENDGIRMLDNPSMLKLLFLRVHLWGDYFKCLPC